MKKIKWMMIAMMAIVVSMSFTACSDDDDDTANNYTVYQNAVNQTVKSQKKNNKVILLVAFGSTWQQAYDAFDTTVAAYKSAFPGYDVFLSFSSAICINRAAEGENVASRNFYAPPFWMNAFAQDGVKYSEIVVQSLQVIPGEEYTRVINYIKDFANNSNGDIEIRNAAQLAQMLGVSQSRLARLFRNTTYKSADDYLDYLRLLRAMQMLREHPEYGIAAISEDAGFNSVRTFQRKCNEAVGMSPVEFRMLVDQAKKQL